MLDNDQQRPDTAYTVPDRSTRISPDDLTAAKPGTWVCDECEDGIRVEAGSSVKCNCGHSWRVSCVPAEKSR